MQSQWQHTLHANLPLVSHQTPDVYLVSQLVKLQAKLTKLTGHRYAHEMEAHSFQ